MSILVSFWKHRFTPDDVRWSSAWCYCDGANRADRRRCVQSRVLVRHSSKPSWSVCSQQTSPALAPRFSNRSFEITVSFSFFSPKSNVRPLELGWKNKHRWRTAARCSCFPVLLVWAGRQEGFVSEPFIFSCSSAPSWRIPGWAGSLIHGTITSYPGDGKWVHQQSGHHSKSNKIWEGVCLCVAIHWRKTTWSCDRIVKQWGDLQLS